MEEGEGNAKDRFQIRYAETLSTLSFGIAKMIKVVRGDEKD